MWQNQILGKQNQPDSPFSKTQCWCAAYTTLQGQRKHVDPSQLTLEQLSANKFTPASSCATKRKKKLILHFICKVLDRLSAAENKGFRNIAKTTGASLPHALQQHITDVALPKLHKEVKMKVLESLRTPKNSAERVTLTCDAWTSRATDTYETLYYKQEWCMTVSRELLQTMCPILESRLDFQTWPRTMSCTQPESRLTESAEVDNTLRDYSAESDVRQPFSEAEPKLAAS